MFLKDFWTLRQGGNVFFDLVSKLKESSEAQKQTLHNMTTNTKRLSLFTPGPNYVGRGKISVNNYSFKFPSFI